MFDDSLFLIALQSGLLLGFIHGVNPCGHSWLVLAPFVAGDDSGKRVSLLTISFILGTTVACLALGLTLGAVSQWVSPLLGRGLDLAVNGLLALLGLGLILRPDLLHHHHHDHGHEHGHGHHGHDHDHDHHHDHAHHDHHHHVGTAARTTMAGLFSIGFVNMIVPCPTVAIMYSYGVSSGSAAKATAVFGIYALGTGLTLAGVIWAIFKITGLMRRMQKPWIEPAIMRGAGALTVIFGLYGFIQAW